MVNILQNECPKPEQRDYIDTLQFAAKNLLSVVNDVLDFNKIAAGKISLEEVEFNLPKLVQDIRKAHLPNANAKGISLVVDMAAGIPERVKADPTRLTQILNNLVGNAVKFTLQGCVTIRLKSCQNTGEKIAVLFNVEDTGIGISEDQKAVIFEQFSQANESITRQFGGTGLGLTITKQLLQLMGSSINVHSKPGEGSCFSFELPMAAAAATACHQTEITARKHFNHLRILLAEDNAINILVTKKMLQKVGATIDVAHNGQEVVDMVSSTAYDVILMDMQMPVMDGMATVKVLRQEKQFTGPVVLLTADAFINHHKDVCAAGFSDYLLKPFGAEELYQKLEVLTNPSFA
jgi:CheY-like chemotaxis protein